VGDRFCYFTMSIDANERAVFAALADMLIPASEGFPSASEAGVAAEGLDEVLLFRPDLVSGLKKLLTSSRGQPPAEVVAELQKNDPAGFALLTEIAAGAYFLNPQVLAKLGYTGQQPKPIDPHPDYLDDGLLQAVLDRGSIYRRTPGMVSLPRS